VTVYETLAVNFYAAKNVSTDVFDVRVDVENKTCNIFKTLLCSDELGGGGADDAAASGPFVK